MHLMDMVHTTDAAPGCLLGQIEATIAATAHVSMYLSSERGYRLLSLSVGMDDT